MTNSPMSAKKFCERIAAFRGKAAAVVYGFSGRSSFTQIWYDQWRSAVISSYGQALEELGVHPYFVDARTFASQALDGSIPQMVCAFNLNAGITPIHHWSMVPAVAGWCGIKPFPSEADVLIVGERKDTANLIARESGLNPPEWYTLDELRKMSPESTLIVKPRDLGGSVGVRKMSVADTIKNSRDLNPSDIIQRFIRGADLTVPVVWQPTLGRHRCVAGILYKPEQNHEGQWFHSVDSKRSGEGYSKLVVSIPDAVEAAICRFANRIELGPYARVDFRLDLPDKTSSDFEITLSKLHFVEVNPLPTLRSGINFLNVVADERFRSTFHSERSVLKDMLGHSPSEHALVLSCALSTLSN